VYTSPQGPWVKSCKGRYPRDLRFSPEVSDMKDFLLALFLLLGSLGMMAAPQAQDSHLPLTKDEVLDLLQSSVSSKVMVTTIQRYGIAFQPTPEILEEFRRAGADEAVLAAVQAAWHGEVPKPLSEAEIRMLLAAASPSEKIVRLVQERGIDFRPTADFIAEIRSKGASDELVGALRKAALRSPTQEELLQPPGPAVNLEGMARPLVPQTPAGPKTPSVLVDGKTATLVCEPSDFDVPVFAEAGDIGKIAAHLRCGEKVTVLERVPAPPGVDKIRYADGKEGFVADSFLEAPIATPGGDVTMPTAIYKPDPEYTPEARRAGIEGTVQFWIVIDTQGNVSAIQESSTALGHGLDKSAMDTVKKWKFVPAKRHGVPVVVRVGTEITFRLSQPKRR